MDGFKKDPSMTAAFKALDNTPTQPASKPLRAVVIGGGTGAPVSIRTLLAMGIETDAVVAMADDGGSTGILREVADATPPGDVRKCLAAFAGNPDDPLTKVFKYRLEFMHNHTLGNLILSALENATDSFAEAIRICEDLLQARGHVYPSTLNRVTLCAQTRDGIILEGQANACASSTALNHVWLHSASQCVPYEPAIQAIRSADLIVLGPGSLFTSIIPNLLVPGIIDAIKESSGKTLFVCSLADMQGETWGLSAEEHVEALMAHGMRDILDYVLIHTPEPLRASGVKNFGTDIGVPEDENFVVNSSHVAVSEKFIRPVPISYEEAQRIQSKGPVVIARNLVDHSKPTWHNPKALREAFLGVLKLCHSPQM